MCSAKETGAISLCPGILGDTTNGVYCAANGSHGVLPETEDMNDHATHTERIYDDLTTNLVSLGTGKGAAGAGRAALPPGLLVVGLFFSDRKLFQRIERGLTHLPSDPTRGAAEIVVLPAGPDLARVCAGFAWLDADTAHWTVVMGESLAPRTDIDLWAADLGEAGAAISVDGPRGLRLFGSTFTALRAPLTIADSIDELLLPNPTIPDALRALRTGISRRRIARVADAPLRLIVPTSTSLNEPGAGLPPDDPALALPQFRFVFAEAEEFKRVRGALEEPAPDTHDLYGEVLIVPIDAPHAESEASMDTAHTTDPAPSDRVVVVAALAWRRESSGWSLLLGAVRTASANIDRWLDDGAGDLRTRVLLVTAKKSGSQEQPVAIDVLSRVTDLRPEMREEGPLFAPDAEPVAVLTRTAGLIVAQDDADLANASPDIIALVREKLDAESEP